MPPNRLLILFAHPAYQRSRANRLLLDAVRDLEGATVHDLYEEYPDFAIDVPREQALLREHDLIVFQHPFYWYGCPALLKEWMDLVLEYGFAYGHGGTALQGKQFLSAITTGGSREAYQQDGHNRFTIRQFLAPIAQTAALCGMRYLPVFVAHSMRQQPTGETVRAYARTYRAALVVAALIAAIIAGGRLLMRPVFRLIAATRLREIFTAAALLLVIGIALAMQSVGLSPALGTFLAGVVLAESEYRHELETDIEPFKGLLLGLFFISVGASVDFALLGERPGLIAGLVAGLVLVKLIVLFVLGRLFKLPGPANFLFTFALAQGGEFGFVLFSFAIQNQVLTPEVANPLVAVVALSMAITPLLMIVDEKLVQPRFAAPGEKRQPDAIDEENPVIIAGFGRFGHIVGRLLKANGVPTTVLDLDPEQIDTLRRFGLKVFYGDASRPDLLQAAGAAKARLLLLAVDDPEHASEIVHQVRRHYPQLPILARANSLHHSYELLHEGADQVFRETLDTALDMGVEALRRLGFRAYQAQRAARLFKRHETQTVRELYKVWEDRTAYLQRAGERVSELEQLLHEDERDFDESADHAWEPPPSRDT